MTNEQLTKIKQETWNLASCIQERSDLVAEIFPAGLDAKCQSLSLVYRWLGLFKKLFVNSNGGTLPMLVCNLS